MRNMLRVDGNLWGKTQERKVTDHIKKNKDIKKAEQRLKEQEKKKLKSRKYLYFIFNLFGHYTVLRCSF